MSAEDNRVAGLRAWVAELDRTLGARIYVLGAIAFLALATGIAALVLTLQLRGDAATSGDLASLREQLSTVERSATQAARHRADALDRRLSDLEGQVSHLTSQQAATRKQLQTLQDDVNGLRGQATTGAKPGAQATTPALKPGSPAPKAKAGTHGTSTKP